MLSDIRINGSASEAVIDIEGVIGVPEQTQFLEPGGRVATYARFAEALAAVAAVQAPRVVVNIRSAGGDVNDALLIFDALQGLGAEVVTRCYGYVASAATVIAQAASPGCREISSNAFYLIHCSESAAEGNSRSLSAAKELLDRTDERIADIYASRSGRPVAGFAALMNENGGKGRWLTPGETVEAGLADTVIPSPVNCASGEMPDGCGDIGTLCRLFGLTPPPDVTGRERCSGLAERVRRMGALSRLFRRFLSAQGKKAADPSAAGKTDGETAVAAGLSDVPAGPEGRLPSDAALPPSWGTGQEEALPTLTKAVEDPATEEYCPTPNEEAYRQDAMNMRVRS